MNACEGLQGEYERVRMLEEILDSGKTIKNLSWRSGEDVMHWWISDVMTLQGQTTFDGFDILDV